MKSYFLPIIPQFLQYQKRNHISLKKFQQNRTFSLTNCQNLSFQHKATTPSDPQLGTNSQHQLNKNQVNLQLNTRDLSSLNSILL